MNWKSFIYLGILFTLLMSEGDVIKRKRAILREGPGSYYPVIAELSIGTKIIVLEILTGWYKVNVDSYIGYLSQKIVTGKLPRSDTFTKMGEQPVIITVTQFGVSAAVKGFGDKFAQRVQGDMNFLDSIYAYRINPTEYEEFKTQTYTSTVLSNVRQNIKIPDSKKPSFFTFEEEGIGYGIAAKLANLGIYENNDIQNYINYVGNTIVENSDVYDLSFKFFILDNDEVNAFACPGGIIFITKGMLKALKSEAELACILGHEIAHISRFHGLKEMEERREQIIAETAISELDRLTTANDDEMEKVVLELDKMVLDIYNRIFSGRLKEYELEADQIGLLYAANAGFDPYSMVTMLNRFKKVKESPYSTHYSLEESKVRITSIQQFLKSQNIPERMIIHGDRFTAKMASLR